jgi:hypothetical protein
MRIAVSVPSRSGPRGQGVLQSEDPERAAPQGYSGHHPQPANQVQGRKARGSKGGRPPAFDKEIYKIRNTVERGEPVTLP